MIQVKILAVLFYSFFLSDLFWSNFSETATEEAVTELIMTCQFSSIAESATISSIGPCDDAAINVHLGNGCNGEIVMDVFVANLSDNLPLMGSGPYPLPQEMPDMYVEYDSDLDQIYDSVIGPINEFYFQGTTIGPLGAHSNKVHYIYQQQLILSCYNAKEDLCVRDPFGASTSAPSMLVRLVQATPNNEYEIYDLETYSSPEDVFSCEVFHETCGFCASTSGSSGTCAVNSPAYAPALCIDCRTHCKGLVRSNEGGATANYDIKQNTLLRVSPNPFKDEVLVNYSTPQKEFVLIEVLDLSGKILQAHRLPSSTEEQTLRLDLSTLATGIYYCRLQTENSNETIKIFKNE